MEDISLRILTVDNMAFDLSDEAGRFAAKAYAYMKGLNDKQTQDYILEEVRKAKRRWHNDRQD